MITLAATTVQRVEPKAPYWPRFAVHHFQVGCDHMRDGQ